MVAAGDLRPSVRQLRIVNAAEVEVREHALSVLETPESIYFENITTLKVEDSGPGLQGSNLRQGRVSITINRVKYVEIKTGSFSHWKEKTLNISIANVAHSCIIYGGAIVSSSRSSKVKLENITEGHFFPGTFATTLRRLTLKNVTTSLPCQNNTFGGHIRNVSLTSVTLGGVQTGCFLADQTWGSLTVRSSSLGTIKSRGLQGTIGDVRILRSRLIQIEQNGFNLNVTSLSITSSSINVLKGQAFNVRATGPISIKRTNITDIRANAFSRLELERNSSEAKRGIILSKLIVNQVMNGSLRFSDVKSLSLRELQVGTPCKCNIWIQVGQLFGRRSPRPSRLYRQAYDNIRCLHNHTTASLREYQCSNCRSRLPSICASANKNAETDKTPSTSSAPSWVLPVVVSLVGLLLLVVITILVVHRHRRRSVLRRRTSHAKRPPSQRLTVADIQHPLPDLTHEAQRMDPQSPGEVFRIGAGSAMLDSSMYETVSGLGGGEDEALHEDVSTYGHAEGEMKGEHQPNTSHVQPLYTQVNKGKKKDVASSEYSVNSARLGDHPHVYAQVNKTKTKAGDLSGEGTHGAQNIGMRGSDTTAKVSETGPGDDTTSDLPVYAQVFKRKPGDKKPDECQSAGYSDISSADPGDDMSSDLPVYAQVMKKSDKRHNVGQSAGPSGTSAVEHGAATSPDLPVYAQVIKKSNDKKHHQQEGGPNPDPTPEPPMYAEVKRNETDGTSQASLHGSSQQTWQSTEAPLYEELSGMATSGDSPRETIPQSSSLVASRLYGSTVPHRPQPTETSSPGGGQEPPVYTDDLYAAVGPSGADEREGFDETLRVNSLYGTSMAAD